VDDREEKEVNVDDDELDTNREEDERRELWIRCRAGNDTSFIHPLLSTRLPSIPATH
jgi:hypothetical protein